MMGIVREFLGPKSKYNKELPYTYMAKAFIFEDDDELVQHYFADTICGLIEYLEAKGIMPEEVELFGLYRKEEIKLDKTICTDEYGNWLQRPDICNALEEHFEETKDFLYKGHTAKEECSFDDRDRKGEGPN
ncbi:MAG: hypothetical protein H6613_13475 [Ignavibacteriales bacterium]|nr:hypothetical protein [Ignavibacteriota bacterium]MCB9249478.1 hypothetical protein [Ignavibacteriales bacterium]